MAQPPSGELARTQIPDTPAGDGPASVPGWTLTALIVVPTIDSGAADEGAIELAHMLGAAGHRAVVATSGGRRERDVTACGAELVGVHTATPNTHGKGR